MIKRQPTFFKKLRDQLRDLFIRSSIRFLFFLVIPYLSLKSIGKLKESLFRIALKFMKSYQARITSYLCFVFGDNTNPSQIKNITEAVVRNNIHSYLETLYYYYPLHSNNPVNLERILVKGKEHLDKALSLQKGVIAVSIHMGAFTLMGLKLAKAGYPFYMLIKDPPDPKLALFLKRMRDNAGQYFISSLPKNSSVNRIISALKKGNIVCIMVDEEKRHDGVSLSFLGKKGSATPTPALLSLRTGAPIIPLFMIREGENHHHLLIEPPIYPESKNDSDNKGGFKEEVTNITKDLIGVVEYYIRRYPEQWDWSIRRWRDPEGKRLVLKKRSKK